MPIAGESGGPLADGGAPTTPPLVGGNSAGGRANAGGAAGTSAVGGETGGAGGDGSGIGGDDDRSGGDAPACNGDLCLPAQISPRWVTAVGGYGRGPASIAFSEQDKSVKIGQGEPSTFTITTLDRVTGDVVGEPIVDRRVIGSDRTGRRLVRDDGEGMFITVDGVETARFGRLGSQLLKFSDDGSAISGHACGSGALPFEMFVYDTASTELISSIQADLPCVYFDFAILVDTERRRTLFSHPLHPEIYVFDWDTPAITSVLIHEAASLSTEDPVNHEGTILNLSLSPDGRTLGSIGAADGLALLDADTLAVRSRVSDVPFFNLYDRCYCDYLSESPLAWSPSGAVYATAHESGGITLRDAQTQAVLSVLQPPPVPRHPHSRDLGPVLLEFSPDSEELVALYPDLAVSYALTR